MDFLTARWSNLVLVSYRVPAEMLSEYLPRGCELDRFGPADEGMGLVSLVAFDFLETRVKGIAWPGHRCFPEINLRFYVTCGGERGVSFVREYVPRAIVARMARWLYNEPYRVARMTSQTRVEGDAMRIHHELSLDGRENVIEVVAGKGRQRPGPESQEHFFKEHRWGFGRRRDGSLVRYEVVHPEWDVHPVRAIRLEWDWASVYGEQWGLLNETEPIHVMVAAGSEVRVSPQR